MVRIALDATYAADPERTGTGVYSERLIGALARLGRENSAYRLVLCFRMGPYWRWARKQPWPAGCDLTPLWEPWLRPRRVALFHGLNQRLPEKPYPVRIVTIHDLFPLTAREYSTPKFQRHFSAILRKTIARADRIIAVSGATRQELLRHTEAPADKIHVIHHGVDPAASVAPAAQDAFSERVLGWPKEQKFFLNVGTIQTRKNIANIVLALKTLPQYRLVLAGGDGYGAEAIHALIEKEGLAERVVRLGHVGRETLTLLYAQAAALVFPSFEEGFGFPILEAMSYGLPVITSNCSSMPEVAGDAAFYVDPQQVAAIREAMRQVAEDAALAAQLRQRGLARASLFRWEKCAAETWQVYQEALRQQTGG